uniref:CCHC-type domain-containing protein n=1 Tax=Knipowitschia caucasica TaxID=637954 RepID=A0AAV2MIG6_KNICA
MRAAGAATYGPQGRGRERRKDSAEIECYRCRKMGHVARNCPSAYEERQQDRRSDAPRRGGWQQRRGKSSNEEPQTAGSAGLDPTGAPGTKKDPAPGAPTEKQQMMETRTTMKTTGRIVLN